MMIDWKPFGKVLGISVALLACSLGAGTTLAEEVVGRVKSLDANAKKLVVVSQDKQESVEVAFKETTEVVTAKGKTKKKVDWARLKERADKGKMMVEVVLEKGVASKIVLKAGKSKKPKADG